LTDGGLEHLSALSKLQRLDISGCDRITKQGLAHIAALGQLKSLTLGNTRGITDADLEALNALNSLEEIKIQGCPAVKGSGLRHLLGTALQKINLSQCATDDAGLASLQCFPGLRELSLNENGITDAGLVHCRHLTSLCHLDLSGCENISGVGLSHLAPQCSNTLEVLLLEGCGRLTNEGLTHLQHLTALKEIGFAFFDVFRVSGISSTGLAHLRGLSALQRLNLYGQTRINDSGLAHLAGLGELRHLSLARCGENISLSALTGLLDQLTRLERIGIPERFFSNEELLRQLESRGLEAETLMGIERAL
jgi:hypothetical protein